jgi:proteasome lid subunit RPN8/RPN11
MPSAVARLHAELTACCQDSAECDFYLACMLKIVALFWIAAVTVYARGADPLDDATVASLAREMLDRAGISEELEHGAFIVAGENGEPRLVHWVSRLAFREARWRGPLPDGVLAVIHTHPHKSPLPSSQDALEARRLGMPFYVVSRSSLSVVGPDGRVRRAAFIPWLLRFRRDVSDSGLEWYWYEVSFT